MPEMNATSFGRSSSWAAASFSAAMTPKSPQPGHHQDAVWVAKSFAVSVAAMLVDDPRTSDGRERRRELADRIDDLDRAVGFAVVFEHRMQLVGRPYDVPHEPVQLTRSE